MKMKHAAILAQFTAQFSPDVVKRWDALVEAWNIDHDKHNPYEEELVKGVFTSILPIYVVD